MVTTLQNDMGDCPCQIGDPKCPECLRDIIVYYGFEPEQKETIYQEPIGEHYYIEYATEVDGIPFLYSKAQEERWIKQIEENNLIEI